VSQFARIIAFSDSSRRLIVVCVIEPEVTPMDRALYSIEETRARLGGISRNSLYAMLRAGSLPSVVIGCRRFVSAEAITALIRNSTTSTSPSLDAVRSRPPLVNTGEVLPSTARAGTRWRKTHAE
jgi:hypothetical protein